MFVRIVRMLLTKMWSTHKCLQQDELTKQFTHVYPKIWDHKAFTNQIFRSYFFYNIQISIIKLVEISSKNARLYVHSNATSKMGCLRQINHQFIHLWMILYLTSREVITWSTTFVLQNYFCKILSWINEKMKILLTPIKPFTNFYCIIISISSLLSIRLSKGSSLYNISTFLEFIWPTIEN